MHIVDLVIQGFIAAGTVGAVIVALFGDRYKAFRVRLSLVLENRAGVAARMQFVITTPTADVGPLTLRGERDTRFYQLRVTNMGGKKYPAHNVNVWLLSLDRLPDNAEPERIWSRELPLQWEHQDFFPTALIGDPRNADMFHVADDRVLRLCPLISALGLPEFTGPCRLMLRLQARSAENNSEELRLRVDWKNGGWASEDNEMRNHLTVEVIDD